MTRNKTINEPSLWQREQMHKERLRRLVLDQELERIQMLKLRSDLTDEQKLEAARIGRIQFVSAGAKRER